MRPKPLVILEPTSFILKTSVRVLFVALNVFAAYLTLKGHNEPGGGFIGGLVSALSLVLVAMVLGVEKAKGLLRVDPLRLTLFGLMLAYGSSLGPVFFGRSFMQHAAWHAHLPGFGSIHLLTAQLFDFGVYFVVVGVTAKMMFTFALSVQLKDPFDPEERSRYATSDEEPIEDAAWAAFAPGAEEVHGHPAPTRPDGEPLPLKTTGRPGRAWREVS
jgi:multicomponent Na+:H+ antiporter subunit B